MEDRKLDALEEADALRYEVSQLRKLYAELNLKHQGLLLDIESRALAGKYEVAEGDEVDIAGRSIRRGAK